MLAYMVTIDKHIGHALHTMKFHEQTLAFPLHWDKHIALIVGYSLQIFALATQRIEIPSMWERYVASIVATCLQLIEKLPIVVE